MLLRGILQGWSSYNDLEIATWWNVECLRRTLVLHCASDHAGNNRRTLYLRIEHLRAILSNRFGRRKPFSVLMYAGRSYRTIYQVEPGEGCACLKKTWVPAQQGLENEALKDRCDDLLRMCNSRWLIRCLLSARSGNSRSVLRICRRTFSLVHSLWAHAAVDVQ